jgi:hypothetical protein
MKFDIRNLQKFDKKIQVSSDSKSNPYTGLDRPLELQEVEAPSISRQSAHEGP